ncbi:MAG: hypothetical protein LBJ00_16750 [Planctomycetaceae bacterium]|jgi:hypothetical protein|nr:hypothetical protein [Planctomycetaceae bacterium]
MFFCFRNIRTVFFWMCQSLFWLVAGLVLLNRVEVGSSFVAGLMGCFVAVIFLLLHLSRSEMSLLNFAGQNWLAVIIFGTLFRVEGLVLFVLIIVLLEIIWWFLLRKIFILYSSCFKIPEAGHAIVMPQNDCSNVNLTAITGLDLEKIVEVDSTDNAEESEEIPNDCNDNKTQQMTRSKTESGGERLEGYFLVEFEGDQLTAYVHVPFCPVFERLPAVDAYLVDAVEAKLTVAKIQRFGARIDVKRANINVNSLRLVVVVWG